MSPKILILGIFILIVTVASASAKQLQICDPACMDDVTVVYQFDPQTDSCVKYFAYPCDPYGCDNEGRTCNSSCSSNADCSEGGSCNGNGRCVTRLAECKNDFTVKAPDGTETSCAPYLCKAGACQQQCVEDRECAPDYVCVDGHRCGFSPQS
jgi:hypothetical protein